MIFKVLLKRCCLGNYTQYTQPSLRIAYSFQIEEKKTKKKGLIQRRASGTKDKEEVHITYQGCDFS